MGAIDPLARYAAARPDRAALVEDGRVLTWIEFLETRNRLADSLAGLGLAAGEHAVVYAHNSVDTLVAGAAVRALDAIPVPMNHRLTREEAAYILNDAGAAVVFVSDAFVPMAERLREGAPSVRHWITLSAQPSSWMRSSRALIAAGRADGVSPRDAIAGSMVYTAGTTGKPKGARRRVTDPSAVLPRLTALDVVDPAHVHLVAGPLYHSAPGGFALYAQILGQTAVVMRKFEPQDALRHIEQYRCTTTFMAPTLLKRIVDLPPEVLTRYDVSSMRAIVVAGAPCPMRVKEAVLRVFGPVLYEFYGSTELGINTVLRPADVLRKPGSCGRPAPGIELAILDDDGAPVPAGTPGELFVRRYAGVFDEYWNNAPATAAAARGDWLSVGDVAWIDEDGFVYIADRKRDMIISGGVNIYPAEIEDVLHRHPAVLDVAVFGVPDEEWGERVHAAVQLRPGAAATEREVIAFCRQRIADFKTPRAVSFHDELPRDAAGKLVKRRLREPYWAGRATRV